MYPSGWDQNSAIVSVRVVRGDGNCSRYKMHQAIKLCSIAKIPHLSGFLLGPIRGRPTPAIRKTAGI